MNMVSKKKKRKQKMYQSLLNAQFIICPQKFISHRQIKQQYSYELITIINQNQNLEEHNKTVF